MFAGLTRRLTVLAVATGVVASTGCGASIHVGAVTTRPPVHVGTSASNTLQKAVQYEGAGFTVVLPDGWIRVNRPGTVAGSGAAKSLEQANPGLTRSFKAFAQLTKQPGVMLVFDDTSAGHAVEAATDFAPNIIIRPFPLDPLTPDAKLLKDAMAQGRANTASLGTLVGAPVTTRLRIGGLPGRGLTYSFREHTAAGSQLVTESDYVTVRKGTAFTIFCTTVHRDLARFRPICAHAVKSFTFTD